MGGWVGKEWLKMESQKREKEGRAAECLQDEDLIVKLMKLPPCVRHE